MSSNVNRKTWTPAQWMSRGRYLLLREQPFLGSLAMNLELIEGKVEGYHTMATDGVSIIYDPKFVTDCPEVEREERIKFGFAHEIMHVVFEHMYRRGSRDPERWVAACEFADNGVVIASGIRGFPGIYHNTDYDKYSADEIYRLLQNKKGKGGLGDGKQFDDCGKWGQRQRTSEEKRKWDQAIIRAATVAKMQGKLPANIERLLGMLRPIVPWQQILNNFVVTMFRENYNMSRPNKRFLPHGVYLPSMRDEELGEIAIAIDSSGSVDEKQFSQFATEVNSLREMFKCEIHFYICDAAINKYEYLEPEDELPRIGGGGGGTDLRPPFRDVEKKGHNIRCFIYLTDGFGEYPEREPDFPVLWVLTGEHAEPPFGERAVMRDV